METLSKVISKVLNSIDGVTIDAYPDFAKQRWAPVRQTLLDGTYRPSPVLRKAIEKPDGGERLLWDSNGTEQGDPASHSASAVTGI